MTRADRSINDSTVLVTGATGFLGAHLCKRLTGLGWNVRALTRRAIDEHQWAEQTSLQWFKGCLHSGEGVAEALSGVQFVVHAAGGGRAYHPRDYWRNNAETTHTLLRAIYQSGTVLTRFVLVSSMAARGTLTGTTASGPLSLYGAAKAESEKAVMGCSSTFPVTILRPPGIYGAGDDRLTPLFNAVKRGLVVAPSPDKPNSWIHVEDCAAAIENILVHPHPTGLTFEVEDGVPLSVRELCQHVARGLDIPAPRIYSLPKAALWFAAILSEAGARFRGRSTLLTRDKCRDLTASGNWTVCSKQLHSLTGWQAVTTFPQSFPWKTEESAD